MAEPIEWDGSTPIEPKIGDFLIFNEVACECAKGGALSPVRLCARCVLKDHRAACGNFNCVGSNRADQMKVYLKVAAPTG